MLVWAAYLFSLSLVLGWVVLYILTRHAPKLEGKPLIPVSHHYSITELFFSKIEGAGSKAHRYLADFFYKLAYEALKRFLPWFRRITRGSEERLTRLGALIKGKRELNYLGRDAASPFIKEVRNHADETGSGKIHE